MSICIHCAHNPVLLSKLPESAIFPHRFKNNCYHRFPLIKVTLLQFKICCFKFQRNRDKSIFQIIKLGTAKPFKYSQPHEQKKKKKKKGGVNNIATICGERQNRMDENNLPVIPIIAVITTYHWTAIIWLVTARTDPDLVTPFVSDLVQRKKES